MDCQQIDLKMAIVEGRVHEILIPPCGQEGEATEEITDLEERAEAEIQDSPGVLEQPEEAAQVSFETTNIYTGVLHIDEIIPVRQIRDFSIETTACRPIIAQTPLGYFCLEGGNLIDDARRQGKDSIECEIHVKTHHSDTELMLMKGGMRTATRGGDYLYPELIRNTRDMNSFLITSKEDLIEFGHGGRRKGEGFVNKREEDARHVISLRLGLDRDTVNSHLNFARCLSDEVIEYFVRVRAKKKFFENAQKEKRKLERKLEGRKLSPEEITKQISELMKKIFDETGGEGRPKDSIKAKTPAAKKTKTDEPNLPDPQETSSDDSDNVFEDSRLKELDHSKNADEPQEDCDEPDGDDLSSTDSGEQSRDDFSVLSDIRRAALDVAKSLEELVEIINLEEIEVRLTQGIDTLSGLRERVLSLSGKSE